MKPTFLAVALFPLLINTAHASSPDIPPQPQSGPSSDATLNMADRCTDFTTNGWAFKAPRNFLKWLDVFSDPGIYLEFARRSLDPQSYVRTFSSMLDPGTPRNYLEWSNPEIYTQWAQAAAEPEYYTAVNSILFDPGRLMRWIMLPIDERAWKVVGTAFDPNTLLKWLTAPNDPKTQALLAKAANPETARLWLEALTDPKNTPWLNLPSTPYGEHPVSMPKGLGLPETAKLSL